VTTEDVYSKLNSVLYIYREMLYLVLGKSGHPFGGLLRTEEEAQEIATQIGGGYLSLLEPWDATPIAVMGQGQSPYGEMKSDLTTMKVPRRDLELVKRYAVWLSRSN
jgi:hypothetical protein